MYYTEFSSAVGPRKVETDLLFPKEEISFLQQNCKKDAYFALLSARSDTAQKKQFCFPVEKMDWVIDHLDVKADTWISQSTFFVPSRRIVCLSGISSLFLDLDYYKTDWGKNKTPEEAANHFVRICQEVGIPIPSLIVFSGRGFRLSGFFPTTSRVLPSQMESRAAEDLQATGTLRSGCQCLRRSPSPARPAHDEYAVRTWSEQSL